MPSIHCCEHPAVSFQFPSNSEKQFLGILKLKINVVARFLLLWTSIYCFPISLNFRERISGLRELKTQYRCPFFALVISPGIRSERRGKILCSTGYPVELWSTRSGLSLPSRSHLDTMQGSVCKSDIKAKKPPLIDESRALRNQPYPCLFVELCSK